MNTSPQRISAAGNVIQLRETCHSEAVTDVTAVGIRIQNVRENGLPRQSADWLAMTKPLTEWHWRYGAVLYSIE